MAAQTARADPSVTITGFFKLSYEYVKIGNFSATGKSGEDRVADDRSRIYFRIVEDLGGGLQAIGQIDWRMTMDAGEDQASGQNWVGLRSKHWGTLRIGRVDLHYQHSASKIQGKGSYKSTNLSLLAFAGGGGTAIANNSRTPNAVQILTPSLNGFNAIVAYSTNAAGAEADIGSAARRGNAWNIAPYYTHDSFEIGYSYWKSRPDSPDAATMDQRGDRIWGSYKWNNLYIGVAWDRARFDNSLSGARTSKRDAWSIPLWYQRGRHGFHLEYSQAQDDEATAASDGAKMLALAYSYDFSRRTSAALTYAKIWNDGGAFYNLYGSAGAQGSADAAVSPGEDPGIVALTLKHSF